MAFPFGTGSKGKAMHPGIERAPNELDARGPNAQTETATGSASTSSLPS